MKNSFLERLCFAFLALFSVMESANGGGDPLYMVVDLSAGPEAEKYTFSYLEDVPAGGWTEEYKTSKLVLRKIPAGSFLMGSPAEEYGRRADETQHAVTLTSGFWMGIFEVTRGQWERVMGTSSLSQVGPTLPKAGVSYNDIRGKVEGAGWPLSSGVDADSFMGRLRSRLGNVMLDLPTEAQWEYACRAGTTTSLNSGKNLTAEGKAEEVTEVGCVYSRVGNYSPITVGTYSPNALGLYDMHGNVWERCMDRYGDFGTEAATDPVGSLTGENRVVRGGGCDSDTTLERCRSASRSFHPSDFQNASTGFRVVCANETTIELTPLAEEMVVPIPDQEFTGEPLTPSIELRDAEDRPLSSDEYAVSYANHVDAGLATVTITGYQPYSGVLTKTFRICPKPLSLSMVEEIGSKAYTGTAVEPRVSMTDGEPNRITEDDFEVSYTHNVHAGIATAVITGKRNYQGTVTKTFEIVTPEMEVRMRPRFPWNGLVDIDVEVSGYKEEDEREVMLEWVSQTGERASLQTVTVNGEPVEYGSTKIGNGVTRFVWDAAADLGTGSVFHDFSVAVSLREKTFYPYCVVDVSGGRTAESYPVSYLRDVPKGGWTEEFKTGKVVLRRIPAGSFVMGSPADELGRADNETQHTVVLTKDFWMGVFEMTVSQQLFITRHSLVNNFDSIRAAEITYGGARGLLDGDLWPDSNAVDANSILGLLRAKTGVEFDLPTEAQWEYACRAGTTTALNSGKDLVSDSVCPNLKELGHYLDRSKFGWTINTVDVGSFLPNQWGLYDMHGNVKEWCLDVYSADLGTETVTDPRGVTEEGTISQVLRGGGFMDSSRACRSASRSSSSVQTITACGVRLAATIPDVNLDGLGSRDIRTLSNAVELDLRTGTREKRAVEQITWSRLWAGEEEATVRVTINGETVVEETSGEGEYEWTTAEPGLYELRYEAIVEGAVESEWARSFVVPGETEVPTEYDVCVEYDGASHSIDVAALEAALLDGAETEVAYALPEEGSFQAEPYSFSDTGEYRVWYKLSVPGRSVIRPAKLTITPKPLTAEMVVLPESSPVYTGSPIEPVVLTDEGPGDLTEGDYTIAYENNVSVGTASVTVTAQGNYAGSVAKTFSISPKPLTEEMIIVMDPKDQRYTGNPVEPEIVAKDGDPSVLSEDALVITYVNNVNVGVGRVRVTGKGNYCGIVSKPFWISDPTVTLTATPRTPWNGLVDIEAEVRGLAEGLTQELYLSWIDPETEARISLQSLTEVEANPSGKIGNGTVKWVWDAASDVGIDRVIENVYLEASFFHPMYCVVDLSGGPTATQYPVRSLRSIPEDGWTEEYKSTQLVLRRIPSGTFVMGSPREELGRYSEEMLHEVTLSEDFWMGVFEVTQAQWEQVMGVDNESSIKGALRPVDSVSYNTVRGTNTVTNWPVIDTVGADSFMGKLRLRTEGAKFDLPTEAQWEYACRAGTTTALNSGKNLEAEAVCPNMAEVGRYGKNQADQKGGYATETTTVGSYQPNEWGLYDMHGNVWEWCLDWYEQVLKTEAVTDPVGPISGVERVRRGGAWDCPARYCRAALRAQDIPSLRASTIGFRLAVSTQSCSVEEAEAWRSDSAITVDTRVGTRVVDGPLEGETIHWSSLWAGDETATVTVSLNGTPKVAGQAGEGVLLWKETEPGVYQWRHETTQGGAVVDVQEATLVIPATMADVWVEDIPVQTYTGAAVKPVIVVKTKAGGPVSEEDYTVTYRDNVEVGTAVVVVTGRRHYSGVLEKAFEIVPLSSGVDPAEVWAGVLNWRTGGEAPWFVQTRVTADGEDALQSGAIGDGETSWVEATILGSGTLRFQWRVSCEERNDSVQLSVDGEVMVRQTGEQPWKTYSIELSGETEHTVRWTYAKGRSGVAGEDSAWLDRVVWRPMSLGEALDAEDLEWTTSGDAVWFGQTTKTVDGVDAAQSGRITHDGRSVFSTTVVGPGTVTFCWSVSCEEWYDWLDFLIDGEITYSLTGNADWRERTVVIPEGEHTLSWVYSKDEMDEEGATGEDCAWVDCVEFQGSGMRVEAVQTVDGVPYRWLEEALGVRTGAEASEYEAVAQADPDGDGFATWAEYVAGSDPLDAESVFRVRIEMDGEAPILSWTPDLGEARAYRVEGRESLGPDGDWEPVDYGRHRFFRVKVALPEE